jgi:uncharacterized membrane protein
MVRYLTSIPRGLKVPRMVWIIGVILVVLLLSFFAAFNKSLFPGGIGGFAPYVAVFFLVVVFFLVWLAYSWLTRVKDADT